MPITRTASLSRHTAPNFVMLGGLELIQLRKLGHLAFRLYLELLAMADHATGRVSTSYAVLLAILDFDQVDCAHAPDKPTTKRIRTALEHLVSLGMVRVDRVANEKRQGLFLRLPTRKSISAPGESFGRVKGRAKKAKTPDESTACSATPLDEGQGEGQGVQEEYIPPKSPSCAQPTEATRPPPELLAAVRARRGRQQAPQGGQNVGPTAHAPRGLRPPESPLGDSGAPATAINRPTKGGEARALRDLLPALTAAGG